jgi:hypothetical protein
MMLNLITVKFYLFRMKINGKYFIKQQEILKKTNSYQLIMVKIIGNKEKDMNKLKNNLVKINKYKFLIYE